MTDLCVLVLSASIRGFAIIEVVLYVDRVAAHIGKHDLIAIPLRRRHLDRIAETVIKSEAWFGVPGVGDIQVVVGNSCVGADWGEWRVQRQVASRVGIGIGYL